MEPSVATMNDKRRGPRKRNRAQVSCNHCRIRKLKCSRTKPCDSCVRTGDAATCSYISNRSNVPREDQLSSDQPSRDELMTRIDRLEQLVLSAVSNQNQPVQPVTEIPQFSIVPSDTSNDSALFEDVNETHKIENNIKNNHDIDQLSTAFGVMKVDPAQTIYIGGSHWVSIMAEIHEFRNFFDDNHEELEQDALEYRALAKETWNSSSLFRGTSTPKSLEELVSHVPARPIADQLIACFFSHNTSLLPIIHEPTFRNQYNEYWNDPTKTKMIWLAMLFGMFNHAELSYAETEDAAATPTVHGFGRGYRDHAIDCLQAADFANPGVHTIEALLLYVQAEWVSSQDTIIETSAVISMTIRLAMRLGIHRDSKVHLGLTPFLREMRRRIWAVLCVMDTLYSFQISLPAIIHPEECDCELPRNIFDHEFDENTVKLPPSHVSTTETEVTYLLLRVQMLHVFQDILRATESSNSVSSEDVMKYVQALDEVRRMVPPQLQIHSPQTPKMDSLRLKRTRINLDRLYQMALCVLHCKFIRPNRSFIQYRRVCIDAALTLLNHQATVYLDCDSTPSIYPQNIRKRHLATLTTHDFFVACMVLSLDLYYGFQFEPFKPRSDDISLWGYDRRDDMITALEVSTEFWRISREESIEAAKAHGMFSFVLEKVKKAQWLAQTSLTRNPSTNESTVDLEAMLSQGAIEKSDSRWPLEFDLNLWNSWNGDGDGFQSLMQWPPP